MVAGTDEDTAKLRDFDTRIAEARAAVEKVGNAPAFHAAQSTWETTALQSVGATATLQPWQFVGPFPAEGFAAAYWRAFEPEKRVELAQTYREGKLKWTPHPEWKDGTAYPLEGENAAFYLYRTIHTDKALAITLSFGSDDAIKVWVNGKLIVADKVIRGV